MNMRKASTLIFAGTVAFVVTLGPVPTFAENEAAPVVAKKKKKKKRNPAKRLYMTKTCMACHGKDGKRSIQDYPNLAGQDKKYMINQIKDIIAKKRTGSNDATGNPRSESMRGALVTPEGEVRISNKEIKAISTWLAGMEPAKPVVMETPPSAENIAAGAKLYKRKNCRTCHGPDGKKPLKSYPFIAGQKHSYIVNQMRDIRDRVRKNGKSKLMLPFARKLSDADIGLLADYLSQIDRTAK